MPETPPRIAVDAMGGDVGPRVNVPAAVQAAREGIHITLVGDADVLRAELARLDSQAGLRIDIVHSTQVVGMNEKPSDALRRKKDSSIQVACQLVKEGKADGVVSAGNSGASVACGMFVLGRIKGVERPALASIMPTEKEPVVLIDVGANVDSKASHLAQFGIMGDVLARDMLGVDRPRVGLLSIGEEEGKGNVMVKEAFDLLKQTSLKFVGNVEGRDIFTGDLDVVVCDGFVGNICLKLSEGLAKSFGRVLKRELKRHMLSRMGAALSMRSLKNFAQMLDYAEYGGAPLLGLKSILIVCHGSSNLKAVTNAIRMAATYVERKTHEHLAAELTAHKELGQFSRHKA
ncbi:MAG: phosphate acyltransferase PlsX [Proteobacteria bacterium]|nr:phosphate acyltransferase PlsX [Pseudomonadota bacterium]MBU1594463.1 phosphate acyltransferase PlsX [Pseudomonadota bacterium]